MSRKSHAAKVKQEAAERGPTPETLAKMRGDELTHLFGLGEVDQRQYAAGEEIREVFGELSAMYFRRDSYEKVDGARRITFHPLDGLPKAVQQRYRSRWVPWRRWAESQTYEGKSYLQWTVQAIIDNHPGYPRAVIVQALERYADIMEGVDRAA